MSPRHAIVFTVTISVFSIILRFLLNNNVASSISAVVKQQPLIDVVTCRQSSDLPKHWCIDNTSTTQYTGNIEENSSLNIQHYIYNGYEKFQVNRTIIVFIGDSTMRYQFMHLVAFLKYQRLMRCEDHNVSAADEECSVIGCRLSDWKSWHKQSTIELGSDEEHIKEQYILCNCYCPFPFSSEYRFIKRSTPYGEINIIYLQNFRDRIRMIKDYPPFSTYWTKT